ncbi:MAG: imidazole glycerol phosphate synthase subunit HisH [Candidatus Altiarchaeales archaeon]|nr:MAG: imidazole glycerol phosphate synthase subunit HisH [Candidatus Altiarchaeales archaeon]HDI73196.1 imidazole glycerol phosphate synthase subunit HisH [Candidatus Altiarchaeales archaeon]
MIAIVDYGMGNIFSIRNALEKVGADVKVTSKAEELGNSDGVVIPGVGSFGDAMKQLLPFEEKIGDSIEDGIPFLGICLGMQILFEKSQESKEPGFGIIPGEVIRLPNNVLVPQMGWNEIEIKKGIDLLDGIENGDFFYFVHSYHCVPENREMIIAITEYGTEVVAVINRDNIYAVQFHPEKSGKKGLLILKNFLRSTRC